MRIELESGLMEATRELDAHLAEHLMGYRNIGFHSDYRSGARSFLRGIGPRDRYSRKIPHYSTDLEAAFTLLDAIVHMGHAVEVLGQNTDKWTCRIRAASFDDWIHVVHKSAALAIANAAFKFIGFKRNEKKS